MKDVFGTGDSDASVVVVLRRRAVLPLFNDAMWAKYDVGAAAKTNDSKTGKPATRNIGCDMATRGFCARRVG